MGEFGEFQCILLQLEIIFIKPNDAVRGRVGFRKGGGGIKINVPRFLELKGNLNMMPDRPVNLNKWLVCFRLEESRADKLT